MEKMEKIIRLRVHWIQNGEHRRDNIAALWTENERLINMIVAKVTRLDYSDIAFEDAKQSAFFGVVDAADQYDPDRGAKFFSFAEFYIRLEIMRYYQDSAYNIRLPERARREVRRYMDTVALLKAQGKAATDAAIRAEMDLSVKAFRTVLLARDVYKVLSLDVPIQNVDGDEVVTLGDAIPGGIPADAWTIESVYRRELHNALVQSFRILSEIQERTLRLVYFQGRDLSEAARVLGCTRQAVFNNHRDALRRIRRSHHRRLLETFL